jgi:hypothetical protein
MNVVRAVAVRSAPPFWYACQSHKPIPGRRDYFRVAFQNALVRKSVPCPGGREELLAPRPHYFLGANTTLPRCLVAGRGGPEWIVFRGAERGREATPPPPSHFPSRRIRPTGFASGSAQTRTPRRPPCADCGSRIADARTRPGRQGAIVQPSQPGQPSQPYAGPLPCASIMIGNHGRHQGVSALVNPHARLPFRPFFFFLHRHNDNRWLLG